SRARGHRAHVVLGSRPKQRPSLLGLSARSALTRDARAGCASRARGHRAHVVLGSRPKQRPSLLGLSARSALTRDARAGCASRVRGQRPLPVCPSLPGWVPCLFPKSMQVSLSGGIRGCKSALSMSVCRGARGFHKGASPLCVLFILLFAQAKNKPSARTGPGIRCRERHTYQKR
ncbi:hypothetical protein C814_03278, partial [Anaerotruncus sp. G3(2012)]